MQTRQFADLRLSRLMLGTCQLGLDYGIANRAGQPSYKTARDIIACAYEAGVNCLDTAAGYGNSEEVVGKALRELGIVDEMVIETKVRHMADDLSSHQADAVVEESVTRSLKRLNLDALHICLYHLETNFRYIDSLLRMRDRGLVRHVGSSVATPSATSEIIRTGLAEVLQTPANVFDRRFTHSRVCRDAFSRGTALFTRSVYLQGLLFIDDAEMPPELVSVIPIRRKLSSLAVEAGIGTAELAARYVLSVPEVTCVLVGVDSVDQMRENLELFARGPLDSDLFDAVSRAVPDLPDSILNPRNWSRRMPDVKPAK